MKKLFTILFVLALMTACSEDDTTSNGELLGTWNLIEILADPGDGSGTFEPLESEKTLNFYSDSTVVANAPLCNMFIEPANVIGTGVYSLKDSTITPDCDNTNFSTKIHFAYEGEYLILYYQCIEACAEKYEMSGQIQVSK